MRASTSRPTLTAGKVHCLCGKATLSLVGLESSLANVGAGGIFSLILQAARTALVRLEYENLAVLPCLNAARQSWRSMFATRSLPEASHTSRLYSVPARPLIVPEIRTSTQRSGNYNKHG